MQPTTTTPGLGAAPRALFAGGGSGGHVFPGLAVARELEHRGWQVSWAGTGNGMEEGLAKDHGLPFHAMRSRPLVGQGALGKCLSLARLAASSLHARRLLRRSKFRVVLGTGGFASAPAAVGARLAGIPLLLLEPNAEPGVANRALSRLASEALLAHESTQQSLRCAAQVTGVPVRRQFFAVAEELPAAPPHRILVLGGSQGARQLNELLPVALKSLPTHLGAIHVLHQSGHRHIDSTREAYEAAGVPLTTTLSAPSQLTLPHSDPAHARSSAPETDSTPTIEEVDSPAEARITVEVVPFLDDVASAMEECHLVVSRAGAITLAELCAAGRPALLVPLSIAGGHQKTNAEALARQEAARVLADDADASTLAGILSDILDYRPGLEAMARNARRLGRSDAASAIADRVEFWGTGSTGGAS